MLSLYTAFTLLLRLSLLCHGQVEGFVDSVQLTQAAHSFLSSEETHLQPTVVTYEGLGSLIPSIEIEERTEVESVESGLDVLSTALPTFAEVADERNASGFGSKAMRGSHLPLYDFFKSWKINLA